LIQASYATQLFLRASQALKRLAKFLRRGAAQPFCESC
jgi:hypothetical protein